jgi:hypothetical protein
MEFMTIFELHESKTSRPTVVGFGDEDISNSVVVEELDDMFLGGVEC